MAEQIPAQPATDEDLLIFDSLRAQGCPPGHFIGDGVQVVRKMLERGAAVRLLCAPDWLERLPALCGPAGLAGIEVRTAPREQVRRLVGFRLHQGLLALGRIPPPPPPPAPGALLVALDGLADAENVGSILRTCAAFGVDGVLVGPNTASPWLRRAIRVSMAAPLWVPVHLVPDLAAALRPHRALAAHLHGVPLPYTAADLRGGVCLVFGAEADGPSPAVLAACRGTIRVPMAPGWDCLNVAASAAVILAEAYRQRTRE
jgi:tRNA G18 (ribose-2'-O)-methylase SpoU